MAKTKGRKTEENKKGAGIREFACLRSPVVTEKSSALQGSGGGSTVAFYVDRDASKTDVRRAVESCFGVEVEKVNTCNTLGKLKRTTRAVGRTSERKKAYVTLKPGHKIDIIEGV